MNILLINYEYPPLGGGASNGTWNMAKALRALGHNSVVVSSGIGDKRGYSNEDDLHVYRVNSKREKVASSNVTEMASFLMAARKALPEIIEKHKPELAIIYFTLPCGALAGLLKNKFKIPYIISQQGADVPGLEKSTKLLHSLLAGYRRKILRNAAAVIANSTGLAEKSMIVDPIHVDVVNNGVDTKFFTAKLGKTLGDKVRFIFVGRFQHQKNLGFLLESFAKTNAEFPNTHLTLVGEGPLNNELHEIANKHQLTDQVSWYPWQTKENLRAFLQDADCFVNPSHYEGMPNAVQEAMACGLPIIASRIMGHTELVFDDKTGYLFDLENNEGLSEVMKRFILIGERQLELSANARKFCLDNFSWKVKAQEYLDFAKK
jgi:glycosyltransferase involved in cell wall biosynthesis